MKYEAYHVQLLCLTYSPGVGSHCPRRALSSRFRLLECLRWWSDRLPSFSTIRVFTNWLNSIIDNTRQHLLYLVPFLYYHFLSLSHPVSGRVIFFSCRAMKNNIASLQIRRCYLISAHCAEFIFMHIPHPYRFSSHFLINPPRYHCCTALTIFAVGVHNYQSRFTYPSPDPKPH